MDYRTAGGGTVAVTATEGQGASHSCTCGDSGRHFSEASAKKAANAHANTCRAIPNT